MVRDSDDMKVPPHEASPDFLRLFYPFHYMVGAAMEEALQGPFLSHHEAVILWMIHSEAENGKSIPRKEIERLISSWYELGSPAVTKVLKRMAGREQPLIEIRNSQTSGREKLVELTNQGIHEIEQMMDRANRMIDRIITGWTEDEIKNGLHFLQQTVDRVNILRSSLS
ncbi:winged helix DNA-binding protein [Altererythrobacter arenosus]|uniref:Winged helix DNA-binding protein n=1 Tax=Altererythrobacter arenosus TaxID=3032592 RepID=A0ABY8FQW3_9SPHN|nr:winged helix DNA-binding protein [Altererythrobacter sp. CAU 1644]WFL76293.1 winged helix DNA-binding protein [Altererythrobacter sp. CAU 1644]